MAIVRAVLQRIRTDRALSLCAAAVLLSAFILALPSLLTPLGLPPEGDGVDYRLPIVQWMLRHGSLPNWPWTIVDDYPSLGEILMVPFYAIHPSLARLVPILGYLGIGVFTGAIGAVVFRSSDVSRRAIFLTGAAWGVTFRPVAIQSNLFMVDNLASCFLLGSLYFVLRRKTAAAGLFAALAMSVRYTTWATAALLPFLLVFLLPKRQRIRGFVVFCLIAGLGPLPYMIRNFLLNEGRIFYPIGADTAWAHTVEVYGRGKDIVSFLLLPFDLLYTNSFVNGIYDYTLGKLFYVQLIASLTVLIFVRAARWRLPNSPEAIAITVFAGYHLVAWFLSGQQMRFLVPSLTILQIGMIYSLLRPRWVLLAVTLLGIFSVLSVQKDSLLIAAGRKPTIFSHLTERAQGCLQRAQVGNDTVGFVARDGVLGFLDRDFEFIFEHPFAVPVPGKPMPNWIYTNIPREGYQPWPAENPCMMKRVDG